MKLKIIVVVASVVAVLLPSASVFAAAASSATTAPTAPTLNASGYKISPVRTELALDPGMSKTITVYVQNTQPTTVKMRASISDFEPSSDESGKPEILLDDKAYAPSHSLKRLASASPTSLTLAPNQTAPVSVTINAPTGAMAGGYYGAVRFLPATADGVEGSGVAFSTNVGSLILLRVNGDIKEKVTLASFDVRNSPDKFGTFFTKPNNLTSVVRFKNEGNVQEQPFGKVSLYKGKKLIQSIEVNNTDPRGNVLPDSIRRFDLKLDKVGKFGKYTVKGNFGWGDGSQPLTGSVTFWIVPVPYIVTAVVVFLLIVGLAILLPIMLRSYNRRILAKARGGRRY